MQNNFAEVIERFLRHESEAGKSENTVRTYQNILTVFDKWLAANGGSIEELTRVDVRNYIEYLKAQKKSAATIEKIFACLSVFARFLDRPQVVEGIALPPKLSVRNIAPKSLSRNERNALLRAVERKGNLRDIAIVYLLLYTGLRVSELCNLNREDVEISERKGKVKVKHGKGDKPREIPLAKEARYHLSRYLETREDDCEALFVSEKRKTRLTPRAVQLMLKPYGTHPHALRHTFCHDLVQGGTDIATVAELAGHADLNVTRRYAKPTHADLERAIEKAFSL